MKTYKIENTMFALVFRRVLLKPLFHATEVAREQGKVFLTTLVILIGVIAVCQGQNDSSVTFKVKKAKDTIVVEKLKVIDTIYKNNTVLNYVSPQYPLSNDTLFIPPTNEKKKKGVKYTVEGDLLPYEITMTKKQLLSTKTIKYFPDEYDVKSYVVSFVIGGDLLDIPVNGNYLPDKVYYSVSSGSTKKLYIEFKSIIYQFKKNLPTNATRSVIITIAN